MSEEIRKPGAEINEAELANVSGAGDEDSLVEYAEVSCLMCCSNKTNACDGGSKAKLLDYMRKNGKIDYLDCPYRIKRRR